MSRATRNLGESVTPRDTTSQTLSGPKSGPVPLVRALTLTAGLVLLWVLGSHVTAPTIAGSDRNDCGSLPTVLRHGTGPHVGELRADQEAFDQRCVARAHLRVWTGGAAGLVLLGGSLLLTSESRRTRRPARAETYVVPPLR